MRKSTADDADDEEIIVVDIGRAAVHPAAERSPSHVSFLFVFNHFGKVMAFKVIAKFTVVYEKAMSARAWRARSSAMSHMFRIRVCVCLFRCCVE